MIGWTFCSGIGAPEVAAPWVDWRLAAEIEAFPRAVLLERFGYVLPEDHNQGDPLLWGDMTEVSPDLARRHGVLLPDLIVAGTPCQAFSIAGARLGTADERGNLTLKFVEVLHDVVAARPDGKLTVLWENVPGVLSDKGNAFGCFLAGLVGADDALHTPDGGSWPGAGMVSGPRARAAWRVLDAQYFGVAQRRRRVFVVVDFGGAVDPAAVLFEPKSLHGNTPPSRETGEGAPGTLAARTGGGGGLGTDFECGGGLVTNSGDWPVDVAPTLNAAFGSKQGLEDQHALGGAGMFVPAETETMIAHAFAENQQGRVREMDVTPALSSGGGKPGQGYPAIAIQERATSENPDAGPQGSGFREDDTAYTLEARHHVQSVAFDLRGREGGAQFEGPHETANLRAASGGSSRSYVSEPLAVRRLTPTECHRLQGFPDDHCAITYRGKPAADGPQYKALGNSMAVPCIAWIIERIRESAE